MVCRYVSVWDGQDFFHLTGLLDALCLLRTPEEFSDKLAFAMKHEPKPMRAEERERLTWEAATERFLDVAELKGEERATKASAAVDTLAFNLYNYLTGQSCCIQRHDCQHCLPICGNKLRLPTLSHRL